MSCRSGGERSSHGRSGKRTWSSQTTRRHCGQLTLKKWCLLQRSHSTWPQCNNSIENSHLCLTPMNLPLEVHQQHEVSKFSWKVCNGDAGRHGNDWRSQDSQCDCSFNFIFVAHLRFLESVGHWLVQNDNSFVTESLPRPSSKRLGSNPHLHSNDHGRHSSSLCHYPPPISCKTRISQSNPRTVIPLSLFPHLLLLDWCWWV